ncbi:hypothetical protein G3N57_31470, partial [Paraburkholderia sp. Se-20369]|nr:hypothetical protein [Paraburkholderia sp. Se-20369]
VGISLGDSLSALHGVIGVLLALRHRSRPGRHGRVSWRRRRSVRRPRGGA